MSADDVALFTLKELEEIVVGKFHALVHPRATPDILDYELAHAFHIVKAALSLLAITPAQVLDTMGNRLNCSTTVDGFKFDWLNFLEENWTNWRHLTILSFHSSTGCTMNNAVLAGTTTLKPVNGQTAANRHPVDISFVGVCLVFDFRLLMKMDQGNHIIESTYYIQLPQDTVQVHDNTGTDIMWTTYHGPDDLTTLSVDERAAFSEPLELAASAAFVSQATINATTVKEAMHNRMLKLLLTTILKEVFDTICPNYSAKLHAVIESIKQWSTDKDGNVRI